MRRVSAEIILFLLIFANVAFANALAVVGGKILTVTHGVIDSGTLIIENGRIKAVGKNLPVPPGAEVVRAEDKVVIPGLIDSGDFLGVEEIEQEEATVDSRENTGPVQAGIRVIDSLNPGSEAIRVARPAGITEAVVIPAEGNPFAGQSAMIRLAGNSVVAMTVKSPAALCVTLGENARNRPSIRGKSVPATTSRMGTIALIRQTFFDAGHYAKSHKKRDLNMEAIGEAIAEKIPVVVSAERESDIEEAIRLSREFHFQLILSHAAEAYKQASRLAALHIPVIVGPILEGPFTVDTENARIDNAAILARAGVVVAFQSYDSTQVRELPIDVEYSVGAGLSDEEALKAVTINPAKIFGVEKLLGSLEPGKLADFVILDGMPFHYQTHVVSEFVRGNRVDLTNHQTRLFEFYKKQYGL